MPSPTAAREVVQRVSELRARGSQALQPLPETEAWVGADEAERRRMLDELRLDLYALTALLAHAVVGCAISDRHSYPPYGLARSRFTEWGLVTGDPEPYEEGALDSFYALWTAAVDTMVFRLHDELTARRRSAHAWTVTHLERLLPLFAAVEDTDAQARKRDAMTFVYGGLQFGSSVSVQLLEVGTRVLARDAPGLSGAECTEVLARSSRPAYRLAALEFDQALSAYRQLLSTAPDTPEQGRSKPGWLDAERFAVQWSEGRPWRVAFVDGPGLAPDEGGTRLGCPARIAADGGDTPIGLLWEWCVEIAGDAGLLEPPGA
jgi:hypothetical protein